MKYCFSKILNGKSFDESVDYVTAKLKEEGFGIITQVDIKETFRRLKH